MADNGKTIRVVNPANQGMWKDSLRSMQPKGTALDMRNVVLETDESGDGNGGFYAAEGATELTAKLPDGFELRGRYFVDERDWIITLSSNGSTSEVGYIDLKMDSYTRVYRDTEGCLNFGNDEWIPMLSKVIQPCNDLMIYWSRDEHYYLINIDDTSNIEECNDLRLFPGNNAPVIQVFKNKGGGYNMSAGIKQYAYNLEDEDGNDTNYTPLSDPYRIGSENNRPGDESQESITIQIDNLPSHYDKVNIAVVETTGGQVTSKIIASEYYSNGSIEFTHRNRDQKVRDIPLAAITVKQNEYIRGKDLFQYDGRLFLYNVRGEVNLDFQDRIFDEVEVGYEVGLVPMSEAENWPGLKRNDGYIFGVHYNLIDGRRTRTFFKTNNGGPVEAAPAIDSCNDCNAYGNNSRRGGPTIEDPNVSWNVESSDVDFVPFSPESTDLMPEGIENYAEGVDEGYADDAESAQAEIDEQGSDQCLCDGYAWAFEAVGDITIGDLGGFDSNIDYANIRAAAEAYAEACRCAQSSGAMEVSESGIPLTPMGALPDNLTRFAIRSPNGDSLFEITNRDGLLKYRDTVEQHPFITGGTTATPDNLLSPVLPSSNISGGSQGSDLESQNDYDYCSIPQIEAGLCNCSIEQIENGIVDQEDCHLISGGGGAMGKCSGGGTVGADRQFTEKVGVLDLLSGGSLPESANSVTLRTTPSIAKTESDIRGRSGRSHSVQSKGQSKNTPCEPTIIYEDGDCCKIKEVIPCIDGTGVFGRVDSCETFPDTKKCSRESDARNFGRFSGERIGIFKVPSSAQEPHFVSYHDGVPTSETLENHESNNSYARMIWPTFKNIPLPTTEELGGIPLNKKNPVTISMIKRDKSNRSVISGLMLETMRGRISDEEFLTGRHGVNSEVQVDRFFENGTSRKVDNIDGAPGYIFHSPDTHFDRPSLRFDRIEHTLNLKGKGKLHGLYAEGEKPDSLFQSRKHRKGARSAVNLNHFEIKGVDNSYCLKAASYAEHDSIVSKDDEFSTPYSNMSRESCVFLEAEGPVGDTIKDDSFNRDVSQHTRFINKAEAKYVDLIRDIPDQYGNLESSTFVPIAQVEAENVQDGRAEITARTGDAFVNLHTVKRTSYVSDKVNSGNNGHLGKADSDIAQYLGIGGGNEQPGAGDGDGTDGGGGLKLIGKLLSKIGPSISGPICGTVPIEGDESDPRNDNDHNGSETDDCYYPQVQTTLVSYFSESYVNLGYRGSGDSPETSTYRDLNGQKLDASFYGREGGYENSWLSRFYATMNENARWKLIARILANFAFTYLLGLYMIFKGFQTFIDGVVSMTVGFTIGIGAPAAMLAGALVMLAGALWIKLWVNSNIDNKFIDEMLDIDECYPDKILDRGAFEYKMDDDRVRGLENNYYEYNYDYSRMNVLDTNLGIPANYKTCDCQSESTMLIYYSNKQNPGSWIDAYRNFKVNNFVDMPAHSGPIRKMFEFQNKAYVHTTDMIYDMRSSPSQIKMSDEVVYMGRGDVFNNPIALFSGPTEGSYGLLDPNASILTKYGYIFIDREARDIYLFSGGGPPTSIGGQGMRGFLDNYLYFDGLRDDPRAPNVDEKMIGGMDYSIGFDPRYDRILVTKNDADTDKSFTASFNLKRKVWVAFHDYKPKVYTWDRHGMYSFNNGELWKHNSRSKFLTFYGDKYDMSIDLVLTHPKSYDAFEFLDGVIDTEAYSFDDETAQYVRNHKVTFDKMALWNSYQHTGIKEFLNKEQTPESILEDVREKDTVDLAFIHRRWRFNEVFDYVTDYEKPLMTADNGSRSEVIQNNISPNIQEKKFYDNYFVNRLIFSKFDDIRLIFKLALYTGELKGE